MRRHAIALPLLLGTLAALSLVVAVASAQDAESLLPPTKFQAGLQIRTVDTHWAVYTPGAGTLNSWESFKLVGLSADFLLRVADLEKTGLYAGGGVAGYYGSYDYETGIAKGNATAGPGAEIRLMLEVDHAPGPGFTLLGQLGASLLYVLAEGVDDPDDSYGVYSEDFEEGLPTIFLAAGFEKGLGGGGAILALLRYDIVEIGSWTDLTIAGYEPWIESADGPSVQVMYRF